MTMYMTVCCAQVYDVDGNGELSREEFGRFMQVLRNKSKAARVVEPERGPGLEPEPEPEERPTSRHANPMTTVV